MKKLFLVPGIGGSQLIDESHGTDFNMPPPRSIWNPSHLDYRFEFKPVNLLHDWVFFADLFQLPKSTPLTEGLPAKLKYTTAIAQWPDPKQSVDHTASVIVVPYDFRRPNAESADWLDKVVKAYAGSDDEVTILAHSMGGLVATYWFAALGGWEHCNRLITLGTPFGGAPKALEWLIRHSGLLLRWPNLQKTLHGWPSMYELLPCYSMVEHMLEGKPTWIKPVEIPVAEEPFLGFYDNAQKGYAFHTSLDEALRNVPEEQLHNRLAIMGTHHSTTSSAYLENGNFTFFDTSPLWSDVEVTNLLGGDGTVPLYAADPLFADSHTRELVPGVRHAALWSKSALGAAYGFFTPMKTAYRGSEKDTSAYHVDMVVPEEIRVGEPVNVRVTIHSDDTLPSGIPATLFVGLPHAVDQSIPLERVDGEPEYRGVFTPEKAGVVTIGTTISVNQCQYSDKFDIPVLDDEELE